MNLTQWVAIAGIAVAGSVGAQCEPWAKAFEKFWDGTKGQTLRRLPVQVVPENAFVSLNAIDFKPGKETFKRDAVFRDVFGKMSPYNCITLTLRCRPDLNDPGTQKRAADLIAQAHADGIKVYMDTDPRSARDEFLRRWPEDAQARLAFEIVEPTRGTASFRMIPEKCGDHMTAGTKRGYDVFRSRLLKAWAITFGDDGLADPDSVRDVTDEIYNAECATVLSGIVSGLHKGEKLVALGEFSHWSADVFSPHLMPYAHELMETYRKLGADGAMKDEWGFPSTRERQRQFKSFWYSRHFAAAWARESGGRDMIEDALGMVVPFRGREQVRTAAIDRYFALTERRNAEIERDFYDANKRLWGPDVYVTKHPTWYSHGDPWRQEFFHNGLGWWDATRDWAQSDETCEVGHNLGMMRLCGGPCWLNEGYGDVPEHYPRALWRFALCGGRMVYHSLYSGRFAERDLAPEERNVVAHREILTAGGAAAESRVRLLSLITRAQPVSAAAFVFGHSRVMNWTDPAFEDLGCPFLHAVGRAGYYLDVFPSTATDRLHVDADGWVTAGPMRYPAVFLHRLSPADAAAWNRLTGDRILKTRVAAVDSLEIPGAETWSTADAARAIALLEKTGAVRQTPFGKTDQNDQERDNANLLPDPDGTLVLLDGTVARIKGSSPDPTGDPIAGTLEGVAFAAKGLFAVRVEQGEAVALAAGGLARAKGAGLDLAFGEPLDLALVKRGGKWRGLVQVPAAPFEIPAALKALTDDWRILVQPTVR